MTFSVDWFSEHIPAWERAGVRMLNKRLCSLLEIGSMEGRSAVWMLENLCDHAYSSLTCVDPWVGDPAHKRSGAEDEKLFDANVCAAKNGEKCFKLKGTLPQVYKDLPCMFYDLVYIDGDHEARSVVTDFAFASQRLKTGAYVIFDDYSRHVRAAQIQPKHAIDAILAMWYDKLRVVEKSSQVIARWIHAGVR